MECAILALPRGDDAGHRGGGFIGGVLSGGQRDQGIAHADRHVELRSETLAFGKPVGYVHGDSHYFRVDKPLLDAAGNRVENFTRVETFGDHAEMGTRDQNWLEVFVDARNRDVFAFQPKIVPANQLP
jgi:hypothetical protein